MSVNPKAVWYHSNQYSADSKCEHCAGVVRHEAWCVTQNPVVAYAYLTATGAMPISEQDTLILHALGVTWSSPEGFPYKQALSTFMTTER